jgi:AAA15 family ATPase/GTPase
MLTTRETSNVLTRLRVSGFKNLVGVDVRFGPFTCIVGANGVGKSNLLASKQGPVSLSSAMSCRSGTGERIRHQGLAGWRF